MPGFGWKRQRLCAAVLLAAFWAAGSALALPAYEEVRASYRPSDAVLVDRDGRMLQELRTDLGVRRLGWTPLEDVSPSLREAVVRAEDKRFFQHAGADWRALAAAGMKGLASGSWRGASTISMQLAAALDQGLQPGGGRRSWRQKWSQVQAARALEAAWSKTRILEAYLNLVFFRGEHQGVAAAARHLFGKDPHGLDAAESLVLAALIRAPNAAAPDAQARALQLGRSLGWPTAEAEVRAALAKARPGADRPPAGGRLAPHAARRIFKDRGAAAFVRCTLDAEIQRVAAERLAHHLVPLQAQRVAEGAALVVDNATGEVRAYVSHTAEPERSRFVDGVAARRQAGSTLKPFLYALALDRRILTAASQLEDSPLDLAVTTGIYQPQNYDAGFQGAVTVRTALASSLNIPAVRALEMIGVEALVDLLRDLGMKGLSESGDFYGPSLALGAADVSLWELVNAYRTLANDGLRGELTFTAAAAPGRTERVFSAEAAFIVSDILADREARSLTFGLESPLATRFWTAVKTGTSKDMRDNWCIGYSRRYTVGVWVGNFSGAPMWAVSGTAGAAPVWLDLMNHLHRAAPSAAGPPPDGLVAGEHSTGGRPRREWFLRGTEPGDGGPAAPAAVPRIVYPPAGAVVAIDPDIPPERQKIIFAAAGTEGAPAWVLDGRPLSAGAHPPWTPSAGRHTVELRDRGGRLLDAAAFQVRGAAREGSESPIDRRGAR